MCVGGKRLAAVLNLAKLGAAGVGARRSSSARKLRRHFGSRLGRQADRPGSRRRQEYLSGRAGTRGKVRAQLPRVASDRRAYNPPHFSLGSAESGKASRTHHGRGVERVVFQLPGALRPKVRIPEAFTHAELPGNAVRCAFL